MNKISFISIVLMFTSTISIGEECEINPRVLGAKYESHDQLISHFNGGGTKDHTHNESEVTHLGIWRRGQEVIFEHPDNQIAEIWNRLPDGRLRMVKAFDEHNRAIEYQAGDLIQGDRERHWQSKYQLITNDFLAEMELVSTEGEGCNLEEHYVIDAYRGNPDIKFEVHWLKHFQIASFFRRTTDEDQFTMQLLELVTDIGQVSASFDRRDAYQSTDYADIGDNESDPFLLKMINLGFIEHGASGFYNADGQPLQGHSGHSH